MKTLADFTREIKVGVTLQTTYHVESKKDDNGNVIRLSDGYPEYTDKDLGVAAVSIVNKTQFAVKRAYKGELKDSWLSFPKASECKIDGNKITIFEEHSTRGTIPVLTYTIVE